MRFVFIALMWVVYCKLKFLWGYCGRFISSTKCKLEHYVPVHIVFLLLHAIQRVRVPNRF